MKLFRRIRFWLRARQNAADLAEEIEFHRSMGGGPANTTMGNTTLAREDARAVWIWPWLESVMQDFRYALRNLRSHPGFALVAIAALGTTIGLTISLFSVFNAVALRPWPVDDPSHVFNILALNDRRQPSGFSLAEFRYLAANSKTFTGMIAQRDNQNVDLADSKAACSWVSASYFRVLGVGMRAGRGFLPEEDDPEAPQAVVVVSDAFWSARLGSDPRAVGRTIRVEETPFTVVGIAASDFTGTTPGPVDLYVPMAAASILQPSAAWMKAFLTSPDHCCSRVAGRMARGLSKQQGEAELGVLHNQFQNQMHQESRGVRLEGTAFIATGKKDKIVPIFAMMFLGVTLVLLLACANVGNLLLARAAARRREISVRLSLGASRTRLIRQLLTESLVLAILASGLGLASAYWLPPLVFRYAVSDVLSFRLTPDTTVYFFALGVSFVVCLMFGLAPALAGTRTGNTRHRLRGVLLAAQVALSVMLLAGASLLVRGIQKARMQDPGFQISGVSIASFELPASSYDAARTRSFFEQLTRELQGNSDNRIGLARLAPLGRATNWNSFRMPGETDKQRKMVVAHDANAGYFDVLGIPILAGRNFAASDADRKVILVNETFAQRFFNGDALGKSVVMNGPTEIVGIVKDAYTRGLDEIDATIYSPITGNAIPLALFRSAPESADRLKAVLQQLEPRARMSVTPLSDNLDQWLRASQAGASIAAALGMFALVLATIGMFGVFAFWVEQRRTEIGVRMALGARPSQVIRLVVGASSRSVAVGLIIGFAGAIGASRLLVRFLYGLSPLDPTAYAGVAIVLGAAGLAATYLPARRATKIDPMTALRCD
jgi:predicted permease